MSAWHTSVCLLMSRSNYYYYYYSSRSHHGNEEKTTLIHVWRKKQILSSHWTAEMNETTGTQTQHCDFKRGAILLSAQAHHVWAWCFGICFLIIPFFIRLEINLLNVPTIWFLSLAVVQWIWRYLNEASALCAPSSVYWCAIVLLDHHLMISGMSMTMEAYNFPNEIQFNDYVCDRAILANSLQ